MTNPLLTIQQIDTETVTKLYVLGEPEKFVEEIFPNITEETTVYVDSLADFSDAGDYSDIDHIVKPLLSEFKKGAALYIAAKPSGKDRMVLSKLNEVASKHLFDEGLMDLLSQEIRACNTPEEFEMLCLEMAEKFEREPNVEFDIDIDHENSTLFRAPGRYTNTHTLRFEGNGIISLDGVILRHTAIAAQGNFKQALMGLRVLTPAEIVGFIANRLVVSSVEELVGYGRAFGPGKEDHTNATLTEMGREFRAHGVVGVITAVRQKTDKGVVNAVDKAKWNTVDSVCRTIRQMHPEEFILPHQMMKEFYFGEAARKAFRAVFADGNITLFGKHAKGVRVDAGAYCLYTPDGGFQRVPALLGAFEEANDGMVYATHGLLDKMGGWLKETVTASRDRSAISRDLVAKYFAVETHVEVGDRVMPGDLLFTVDGVEHRWESKANHGIVTKLVDEFDTKLVKVEVGIDAHFTGDAKIRGFGKGLVAPAEACGISAKVKGERKPAGRLIVGVPGIVKDSAAANSYIHNPKVVKGVVTTEFNARDYELHKLKHMPTEEKGKLIKRFPNLHGLTMEWNDDAMTVTTTDPQAIACEIDVLIEAAPVAQSVGTAGMTMPQMAWLSSLPTGNQWLRETLMRPMVARIDSLAYLHAVANRVPVESGHTEATATVFDVRCHMLGRDAITADFTGLTDMEILGEAQTVAPHGINLMSTNQGPVWVHPERLVALAQTDGFGLELIGIARTAAELLKLAADPERAQKLGGRFVDRMMLRFARQAEALSKSKRINQPHAVRWGAGAKVAGCDKTAPYTLEVHPTGNACQALADAMGCDPSDLENRWFLILRAPFILGYAVQVVFNSQLSSNLVLVNRLEFRKVTKGDFDGDNASFFPIKDDTVASDLALEIAEAVPDTDSTLAIRGMSAESEEAEMWGEIVSKTTGQKLSQSFTKTVDEWLALHSKMGDYANVRTPYAYRISEVGAMMAALGSPGAQMVSLMGAVIEEDYYLGLSGGPDGLDHALELWMNGKFGRDDQKDLFYGLRKAVVADLLTEDNRRCLLKAGKINQEKIDLWTPEDALTHMGWLMGKGLLTANGPKSSVSVTEKYDAIIQMAAHPEFPAELRDNVMVKIIIIAARRLTQVVGRKPAGADDIPDEYSAEEAAELNGYVVDDYADEAA